MIKYVFGPVPSRRLGQSLGIDTIVAIITCHPMSEQDLVQTLARWAPGRVQEALDELEASGRAQVVPRYGVRFWSAAPSYYPAEAQSEAVDPRKHQPERRH